MLMIAVAGFCDEALYRLRIETYRKGWLWWSMVCLRNPSREGGAGGPRLSAFSDPRPEAEQKAASKNLDLQSMPKIMDPILPTLCFGVLGHYAGHFGGPQLI